MADSTTTGMTPLPRVPYGAGDGDRTAFAFPKALGAENLLVHVGQHTTTGNIGTFTCSARTDGRICVANRMSGSARKPSLHLIGAPL